MKKRFYSVSNILFSSLIAMLGLGACKSQRAAENTEPRPRGYEPPPVIYVKDTVVAGREPMKVVYGPPVVKRIRTDLGNVRPDADGVYDVAEIMPRFPGGEREMVRWIRENMNYPEEARQKDIYGRVIVSFNVMATGSLDGVAVVRSLHPLLDAEAIRLVKSMPKWNPGMMNGEAVVVRYFIPIEF